MISFHLAMQATVCFATKAHVCQVASNTACPWFVKNTVTLQHLDHPRSVCSNQAISGNWRLSSSMTWRVSRNCGQMSSISMQPLAPARSRAVGRRHGRHGRYGAVQTYGPWWLGEWLISYLSLNCRWKRLETYINALLHSWENCVVYCPSFEGCQFTQHVGSGTLARNGSQLFVDFVWCFKLIWKSPHSEPYIVPVQKVCCRWKSNSRKQLH